VRVTEFFQSQRKHRLPRLKWLQGACSSAILLSEAEDFFAMASPRNPRRSNTVPFRLMLATAMAFIVALASATKPNADPIIDPDGTDAYSVLGWSGAADELCGLNTQRIILLAARSKGLTDTEIAHNLSKIMKAVGQAYAAAEKLGRAQWCANYQRGLLTGR
jgi:hypothetical protein